LPGFNVDNVSTNVGGNSGRVTVKIEGAGFTRQTEVSLISGATEIAATFVDFRGPSLLFATFDLSGSTAGSYDVRVTDGARQTTSPSAFEILEGGEGDIDVDVQLIVPETARTNATFSGEFDNRPKILVTYENKGTVDVPAPLFQLTTDFGQLDIQQHTITDENGALLFLGTSADGPAGVLRPGAKGRIEARLTLPVVLASTSATITVTGSSVAFGGDRPSGIMINWAQRKAATRPDFIPVDAWDPIWDNFTSSIGATTDDFERVLADNATYLSQLGENVADIGQLLGFELQQASASLPVAILDAARDAEFPTPGVELNFDRVFLQPIAGRYRLGPLGRGWAHQWEIQAATDADGNVQIDAGGALRYFIKQPDGSYRGVAGDRGALSLVGGDYQLREVDGTVTVFRPDGTLDYIADSHGTRVTAGYDAIGRLSTLTHSTGPALTIQYNAQGRISQVTDPAGRVTNYVYDASGEHLINVSDARGSLAYAYVTGQGAAREHALAGITHTDGTHLFFDYDSRGRLAGQHGDGGVEALTYSYDSAGGVTITDAAGGQTQMLFDELGQIQQVRDPLGRRADFDYDSQRNLVLFVSPSGLEWTYEHDARGNVIRSVDPLGQAVERTFDPLFNQLSSFTDARGKTTHYDYNNSGDLLSITYPNGSQEQFDYDPLGNLTESINRRGRAIDYLYNSRGLVTRKQFADGSHADFTYDDHGNLLTATDAAGVIAMDYNAADRLTKVTYPGGRFLEFAYDAGGRRMTSTDQDGFTIHYLYNEAGRLSELTDGAGATIVHYTYDAVGYLARKDLGNGTFTTYSYDAAGQVLSLVNHAPDGAVNSQFDYAYDAEGRRISVTTLEGATTYGYDAIGQLTSLVLPGGRTILYDYDAAGNRIAVTDDGITTSYVINDLNQILRAGQTVYTYDADGNRVSKTDASGTTSYTFDDENQLIASSGPGGAWSYQYNPFGDRIAAVQNGQRSEYLIDPAGLADVVAEYGAGGLVAHYAHGLGLISRIDATGVSSYYDFDALGSTVGLSDVAGGYVNRYSYLPFGETTTLTAAIANPFAFVGEYGVMTAGDGLQSMRLRFYDPQLGQFISDDPIGVISGDLNFRRYAGNDPVSAIDPSGLRPYWQRAKGVIQDDGTTAAPKGNPVQDALNIEFLHEHWLLIEDGKVIDNIGFGNTGSSFGPGKFFKYPAGDARLKKFHPYGPKIPDGPLFRNILKQHEDNPGNYFLIGRNCQNLAQDINDEYGRDNFILQALIRFFSAFDPNEIEGPIGFGDEHFVKSEQSLPYTIRFENDPEFAMVPAQEVVVRHQLDADLDWTSVELDDVGFGEAVIDVPDGVQSYQTRLKYHNQDGSPLFVDLNASLDQATGILTWAFRSVDPATGFLPAGVFDGFLPVNDGTHRGEGFVRYIVRPKAGLASGTTIDQLASIVFDVNQPVITNTYVNTVDSGAPSSSVATLPVHVAGRDIALNWSGSDDAGGSGIASYDIFVSTDNGPYVLLLDDTTQTSTVYTGEIGHAYRFYSVAMDNVGHVEAPPAGFDAETTLVSSSEVEILVTGADAGGGPHVRVFDAVTLQERLSFFAYTPGFAGGVRVATGDINGDGTLDIITAPGPGGGPHIRVFDGLSGAPLAGAVGSFFAYSPLFTGGVFVASADVNGDGRDDIITGAGAGGGPHVRVFNGLNGTELMSFYAYNSLFTGGVDVAAGYVNADNRADIITGAGAGGGPHVRAFSGSDGAELMSFFAYTASFTGGAFVAAGDVNGDGRADIVTGAGAGGGPHVRVLDGQTGAELQSFYAFNPGFSGGVRVATAHLNGDNRADILAAAGPGSAPAVRGFNGQDLGELAQFVPYNALFVGGVFLAGGINSPTASLRLTGARETLPGPARIATSGDLIAMAAIAVERLAESGLSTPFQDELRRTRLQLADLPGDLLGLAINDQVLIDIDAAGQGWFLDSTPLEDEEFQNGGSDRDGVDLLTVVLHEFGHRLGFEDASDDGLDELMRGTIEPGVRRLADRHWVDVLQAATEE
jgi:RHS repeat-associated protein